MTSTLTPVERNYQVDGITLHVASWEHPTVSVPPLVLLHGIWDTWRTFDQVAGYLAASRTMYAVDLRGHGDSSKPEHGYRFADYAADVRGLLAQLPHERVDLLGFSLGSLVAITLVAQDATCINRLILEDPPAGADRADPMRRLWFEHLLELKRLPFEQVVDGLAEMNPTRDRATNELSARALMNTADGPFRAFLDSDTGPVATPEQLTRLTMPVLILRADPEKGGALPDEGKSALTTGMSHARLVEFDGVGHLIHGERPEEFVRAVKEFLG
jgi:pimeloyl-ACP methyl ester carboxylesterase